MRKVVNTNVSRILVQHALDFSSYLKKRNQSQLICHRACYYGTVTVPRSQRHCGTATFCGPVPLPQYHLGHLHYKTVCVGFATAKHPVKVTERELVEIMHVYPLRYI